MSEPKTKRGRRTIALDPVTLEALKAHAARQADEQADWEEAWVDSGFIFTREDGEPLHPWRVSKAFQRSPQGRRSARRSRCTACGIPMRPWLSPAASTRGSSRRAWATRPWP